MKILKASTGASTLLSFGGEVGALCVADAGKSPQEQAACDLSSRYGVQCQKQGLTVLPGFNLSK